MRKQGITCAALCLCAVGGVLALIYLYFHSPYEQTVTVCLFYRLTGFKCPGCGMTRALYCLLHLDFKGVFRENPFLLVLPFAAYLALSELFQATGLRIRLPVPRIPLPVLYTLLAVWVLYGFGRNFV